MRLQRMLGACLLLITTSAYGVTLTQTYVGQLTPSSSTSTRNVPVSQFNPSLGTLQSIAISVKYTADWTQTTLSNSSTVSSSSGTSTYKAIVGVTAPTATGTVPYSTSTPLFNQTQTYSGATAIPIGATVSETLFLTDTKNYTVPPSEWATYTGTGAVTFSGRASYSNSYTFTPANVTVQLRSLGSFQFTVTYTYDGNANTAAIGDLVWNDLNGNGIQDNGEPGISGIPVNLKQGGVVATTTTDSQGIYSFTGLAAGSYTVEVDSSSLTGWKTSPTGQTTSDKDSSNSGVSVTLALGETNNTIDFGFYQPQGKIGDTVWKDLNHNGKQDDGDTGIDGVTVELCLDANCTVTRTTTTGLSPSSQHGYYQFSNLPAGNYTVRIPANQGVLSGLLATFTGQGTNVEDSNLNPSSVSLATDFSADQTIDFGFTPPGTASIGDFVWSDLNHNGVQDITEPGIPGVVINLGRNNDCSQLVATTTTDALGIYKFTGLFGGTYYVCVATTPVNYVPTAVNVGNTIKDSNANPFQVILPDYFAEENVDFGFVPPATGAIGNFVWHDQNRNGVQDLNEPGINNVTVRLYDSQNALVATTSTINYNGGDGYYQFTGLQADTYRIEVSNLPAGYTATPDTVGGDPAKDSNGVPAYTTLSTNSSTDQTIDFGYQSPCAGIIGNFVWNDANRNGIQDPGEVGIPGVTVNLRASDNSFITSTMTDQNGAYAFTGRCQATYRVEALTPSGFAASPSLAGGNTATDSNGSPAIVVLPNDATDNSVDFGFYPLGSIGDRVWLDANGNGVQEGTETGLVGWTVQITGPNGYASSMATGANGSYSFNGLEAGAYSVCVVPPSGYLQTYDLDGIASANCAAASLAVGENRSDVDFGYKVTPPVVSTCSVINAIAGTAITPVVLSASGGTGTGYTFSVSGLPAGLTFDGNKTISGTPSASGNTSYTVTVTDSAGNTGTSTCAINVLAAVTSNCVVINAVQGVAITPVTLSASGGTGSGYTYSVTGLPAGLLLTGNVISGTPTVSGSFSYTVIVKDSANNTGSSTCAVTVTPPPTVNKVTTGDTATIGFWQNKNGQAIILSLNGSASSKQLANWLATTFPALYGAGSANNLTNKTNTDVANLFLTFFNVKGTKTDAQVMGGALAAYVTNTTLAGSTLASKFGFTLSATGTGAKYWNTGSYGTAIGLANNTNYTVTQLLIAANAAAPYSSSEFNALNSIFDGINQAGDIK